MPFLRRLRAIFIYCCPLSQLIGSPDKSSGIIDYNQSGKLQQPAWKAVHIACDVGNRVHTRNDSDEDVRGNAYKQTIAWRALPWSFIMYVSTGWSNLPIGECRGKALQAIVCLIFLTEGYAALAPGYLHRQADVYCLPGKA